MLLLSWELGIPDLPSFLQMTRERERRNPRQKTEAEASLHPDPRETAGGGGRASRSARPPFGRLGGAHVAKRREERGRGGRLGRRLLKILRNF